MDVTWTLSDRKWEADPLETDQELRCTTARRRPEFRAAFRLLYDSYCRNGLAPPNRLGLRILPHQLLETSWVLLATRGHKHLGTLSLIEDGAMGLPVEVLYPADVWRFRRQQLRVAELSCFASRGRAGVESVAVLRALLQSAIEISAKRRIHELVICVHPRHTTFYQRRLGFREFGSSRLCPWVCGQPGVAMSLSVQAPAPAREERPLRGLPLAPRSRRPTRRRLPPADLRHFRQLLAEVSPFAELGQCEMVA